MYRKRAKEEVWLEIVKTGDQSNKEEYRKASQRL
jgi:hypothetical protein